MIVPSQMLDKEASKIEGLQKLAGSVPINCHLSRHLLCQESR